MLLEHYPDEQNEAIAHLDFAIGELRDMKMQPSLEKALRHRENLRGVELATSEILEEDWMEA